MRDIKEILRLFPRQERGTISDVCKSNLRECREWLKELRDTLLLVPEFRTFKSYVSYIHSRGDGGYYRNGLWLGIADKQFGDPHKGMQFQFGIDKRRVWSNGIWIEGDGNASRAKEIALKSLSQNQLLFIKRVNGLGNKFVIRIWKHWSDELIFLKKCGVVGRKDLPCLLKGVSERDCYVHIGQPLDERDACALGKRLPETIIHVFKTLLPLYALLQGAKPPMCNPKDVKKSPESDISTRIVSQRGNHQLDYEVHKKAQVVKAKNTEARLLMRYKDLLRQQDRKLESAKYGRLECDGFEQDRRNLIEAKSTARREHIRMAVGQLLDYAFQGRRKLGKPRMAILVPSMPAPDVEKWLKSLRISVIWYEDGVFKDNADDHFV